VQKLQRLQIGQAWTHLFASRRTTDYEYLRGPLPPLSEIATPEAMAALQQLQTIQLRAGNGRAGDGKSKEENDHPFPQPLSTITALAAPLKLRDEVIGVLGIHAEDPQRSWTEDEIALIEAVSEQMSLAIENARLFETTGRQAAREKLIADMTRQVWASGEMERVMQMAVEQLGITLDASKVVIRLGTEEELMRTSSYGK
jgi:GAF domain-containing protein